LSAPIPTADLPTHVALVARRLNVAGLAASADSFLYTSYLAESAIKSIATVLYAALATRDPGNAYRLGHGLVRDNGLGGWDAAIQQAVTRPLVQEVPQDVLGLVSWATQKRGRREDQWFRDAKEDALAILELMGLRETAPDPTNARGLVSLLVYIRNKAKAHGAEGEDFFADANAPYLRLVRVLITSCPVFSWTWFRVSRRSDSDVRAVLLRGESPYAVPSIEGVDLSGLLTGLYFAPQLSGTAYRADGLITHNRECSSFRFANGGFRESGESEFIDYATGERSREDVSRFVSPPTPLPRSETHGLDDFEVQSNVFGNLPSLPSDYVRRPELEAELRELLTKLNYHVVTLHGPGGVGKTRLALWIAHELAGLDESPFEHIVWFSARDIDLTARGPVPVRPAVADLEAAARAYGRLFEVPEDLETFQAALGTASGAKGTLFIFDNFETVRDKVGVQSFLGVHTALPNKVLITSRERAFKGDYPIRVSGMEVDQARQLLVRVGRTLGCEDLFTSEVISKIHEFTDGYAYAMRLMAAEVAKAGRFVSPRHVVSRNEDILDAVFERSYGELSESARTIFLTIANWRSVVSELALLTVLGVRDIDVPGGLAECLRFALVEEGQLADGEPSYWAPQLAREFARRKLRGNPGALAIRSDLEELKAFGVIPVTSRKVPTQSGVVDSFVSHCLLQAGAGTEDQVLRLDALLERVAEYWPPAWLSLIEFRSRAGLSSERIMAATQRAVEELPGSRDVWIARLRQARRLGHDEIAVAAQIELAELDPADVNELSNAATALIEYLMRRKEEIPRSRRHAYLRVVRERMVQSADALTATALSKLAWLFLLEGDESNAWRYASQGLQRNAAHQGCQRLLQRLTESGYRPTRVTPGAARSPDA
jgi:hypothetical protein